MAEHLKMLLGIILQSIVIKAARYWHKNRHTVITGTEHGAQRPTANLQWRRQEYTMEKRPSSARGVGKAGQFSQFSSVAHSCLTLCDPMNHSSPGFPVHHQLPEFTQTHVHRVSDAIQPSHSLSSPSPPAPNPSQHQRLFQWVNSLHEVAKVLEFQL